MSDGLERRFRGRQEGVRSSFVQPKAEDAAIVEKLGLMKVPRRFSFREAHREIANGTEVIARSEHPEEATGLSGVNPSYTFTKEKPLPEGDMTALKQWMGAQQYFYGNIEDFCRFSNRSLDEYISCLSWSLWEKIPGTNLSVIEDNAVQGRHWLIANWTYKLKKKNMWGEWFGSAHNMFLIEDGSIQSKLYESRLEPKNLAESVPAILDSYGKIGRQFGEGTAWIAEMQLAPSGELYFLQRHPTRQYEKASWKFDSAPEPDEIVIKNSVQTPVRGATAPEGKTFDVIEDPFAQILGSSLPQQAVYTHMLGHIPIPIQERIAAAEVFLDNGTHGFSLSTIGDNHSSLIPFTKAGLYVAIPKFRERLSHEQIQKLHTLKRDQRDTLRALYAKAKVLQRKEELPLEEWHHLEMEYFKQPDTFASIRMHIRSDGQEARIKILDIL